VNTKADACRSVASACIAPTVYIIKTIMAPQDEKRSPRLACGDTQRDEGGGFQLTKNRDTVTGDYLAVPTS